MELPLLSKSILLFVTAITTIASYSQDTLCDKKGPNATNQRIREKIYENVRIVKAKVKTDTTLLRLRQEYIDLQTSFNSLYTKMKDNLGLFRRKRNVCEKYGSELGVLVNKAGEYNVELIEALKKQPPAALGVSDVLSIIDWIFKKGIEFTQQRKDAFYNELKWDNWDDIK